MAYEKYTETSEKESLNVNHLNNSQNSTDNSEATVSNQEQNPPINETIPKLNEAEQLQQEKWRNSKEMQTGLNEILPKKEEEKEEQPSNNLNELVTQLQTENQHVSNPDHQEKNKATGIPQNLKDGIERLSGMSLDDITVHYNSNLPAKYNALAYAQGSEIHIASGQEKHLPHELAHIVQQKEGRVKATGNVNGTDINTDSSFEKEADQMADKVLNTSSDQNKTTKAPQKVEKPLDVMQQEGEGGTWEVPRAGASAVSTFNDARWGLVFLTADMMQLKGDLPDGSDTAEMDELIAEMEQWVYYCNDQEEGADLDSYFTSQMVSFNEDYRRVYDAGLDLVRAPSLRAVRALRGGEEIEPMDDDTQDALRAAFSSGSEGTLEQISSLIAAIEEYNTKINDWTGYIGVLGDSIRGASSLSRLNEITGNIGDVAERIQQVITAMQSLGTLLDASNQAATESMQMINDMEATFNGIDLGMSFVRGVPLLSSLWSSYYMPAIEICLGGIRRIAALRSEQAHDLVELNIQTRNDQSTAPSLRGSEHHFPGGQAVFDFIWQVMRSNEVEASQEVHSYFSDREDLFEAGTSDEMRVTGASITDFWEDNRVEGLYWYCRQNRDRIWAMLYGSRLTPPR